MLLKKKCQMFLSLATVLVYPAVATEAASTDVLHDVRSNFQSMRDEAESVEAYHTAQKDMQMAKQDLEDAKKDLLEAKEYKETADLNFIEAQKAVKEAQYLLQSNEKNIMELKAEAAAKTKMAIASQQAVADFLPNIESVQSQLDQLQKQLSEMEAEAQKEKLSAGTASNNGTASTGQNRSEQIAAALNRIDYAEEYLSQVEQEFGEADAGTGQAGDVDASTDAADKVDELNDAVDSTQDELIDMSDQLADLQEEKSDAEQEETDARQSLAEAKQEQKTYEEDLKSAQEDLKDAALNKKEVKANLEIAVDTEKSAELSYKSAVDTLTYFGEGKSAQAGLEMYTWRGRERGHQTYLPVEFNSADRHKNIDISLSSGYVSSDTGLDQGSFSGWTDAQLGISRLNAHKKYDVRYRMDVNLPTGKSAIYNNAVVPDDLARFTRFGEGWNWAPGITVTKHITDVDSLIWDASYAVRGSYEYTKDIPGARIDPGNLLTQNLTYLHAEQNKKFMGRLFFTDTGRTDENGLQYTEGRQIGFESYYEKSFSKKNAFEGYAGFSFTGATDYLSGTLEPNSDVRRQYFGLGMSHQITPERTLRILGNYARSDGYSYNPLTNMYSDNRHRVSLLVGYEEKINEKNSISLYLERYVIKDNIADNYNGWGANLLWNRNF